MSCGVDCRRGSDPELLWLWHRSVAPIGPLAWESPHATGAAQEIAKKKKKKKGQKPGYSILRMIRKEKKKKHKTTFFQKA